jgi:hypothetical protein
MSRRDTEPRDLAPVLAKALHDAVDGHEPADALPAILHRTQEGRRR